MKSWLPAIRLSSMAMTIFLLVLHTAAAQVVVFTDDFSTNTSATWTTTGPIGASAWSVSRSGDDWGARRNTSPQQMELTNDASATNNVDGFVLSSTPTTSFASPYNATLNMGGPVTWTFNMRQIRSDPAGFGAGSYGVAFILAGTANTTRTTGSGYAVVLGQSLATDPVRLVSYSAGLASHTNIIVSNTAGLTDFGAEYLSLKVTYNPCNSDQWEFFVRNDGTSAFADPLTGTLTSQGTANNNTYVGTSLPLMAGYWQGSTAASQTSFFDNVTVSATAKPSITVGSNPTVCQGGSTASLSYANAIGSPDQYSIDYNTAANTAGFVDVTNASFSSSPISLAVPPAAPAADYSGVLTVRNSMSGCVSASYNIIIHIISCTAPYMAWTPLHEGEVHGTCTSTTECTPGMGNQICYGLQYIPNHTGTLTSYTTGFFIDCSTSGNPVVSNHSCIMTDNSLLENGCVQFGLVKINSSGNTGSLAVTQNVPIYIHQVCFTIPTGEYLDIVEDVTTDLTTSIDLPNNGGPITEFPGFTPAVLNWNQECIVLPLTWLDFQARRYDELVSKLDWSTADEINTAYFEVQRSNDNGRNFQTIGRVEATSVPTAVNAYQFMDRKALTGKNYYRIRQVDYDGRYDFSPIRTVTFATGKFAAKAWPNPASEEMTITIDHAVRDGRVLLVDFTGRQVREIDFNAGSTSHTLTVNDLQPGMYTLLISSGDDRLVEKIVIMK